MPYASKEDRKAWCKRYYVEHKDEIISRHRRNRSEDPVATHARDHRYYLENREAKLLSSKIWAARQPIEERRAYMRRYVASHRDHLREMARPRNREARRRENATPMGRLNNRMCVRIWRVLRGKKAGRRWEDLVGYTVEDLRRHIEARFKPGMSWERLMLAQIEIDHIIPVSKFSFTSSDDPDFRRCWALENLSPEWKSVNMRKSARIIGQPQIALGI